jgi:transposase
MVNKLSKRGTKLHFCYEAGLRLRSLPADYRTWASSRGGGAVAGAQASGRSGEDQPPRCRQPATPAPGGELTAVRVPDDAHEAIRDLVRAREAANSALKQARQQLQFFLLRHRRALDLHPPHPMDARPYKMAGAPDLRPPRPPHLVA